MDRSRSPTILTATLPRTTAQAPFRWSDDESWRDRYARVDADRLEQLRQLGDARRERQRTGTISADSG